MLKHLSFIFLSSLLYVVIDGQSLPARQRNLNDYEKINVKMSATQSPGPAIEKVREFIWQHWTNRTLGYAELTLHNKEGEPSHYFIYIEPNESGKWRVSVKIESEIYDRRLIGDPKRTGEIKRRTRSYEAYIVERSKLLKARAGSTSQSKQNNLWLIFKDRNGNLLAKF